MNNLKYKKRPHRTSSEFALPDGQFLQLSVEANDLDQTSLNLTEDRQDENPCARS
jgi:hypothetical protein